MGWGSVLGGGGGRSSLSVAVCQQAVVRVRPCKVALRDKDWRGQQIVRLFDSVQQQAADPSGINLDPTGMASRLSPPPPLTVPSMLFASFSIHEL